MSVTDARTYAARRAASPALKVVVRNGDRQLAGHAAAVLERRSARAAATRSSSAGREYRVQRLHGPGAFAGQRIRVFTLGSRDADPGAVAPTNGRSSARSCSASSCSRSPAPCSSRARCSASSPRFLEAARKLAGGDFSAKVPTVGRDEFAALGEEFNKMSGELERRLAELAQERERVQYSMRRLGEAVASKLDRDALLEIVVRTAVDGVAADAGPRRASRGGDRVAAGARARGQHERPRGVRCESVEADALSSGSPREATVGEATRDRPPAARRRRAAARPSASSRSARCGRPFTQSERELFPYLAGQAARSMESVDLHETDRAQSITDDLTGLVQPPRASTTRSPARSSAPSASAADSGLVLIDLDNFKTINDTYGHPQGDVVLREVARVLRESSREIDYPARYGGEELALVLPGTDLEGAFNLAERVRERIGRSAIPRLDGAGALRVTASCGVAAVALRPAPTGAPLVQAADSALYEAKRSGKNKSVRAR